MTTQARIAAFLSTSALCLGLAAAPVAHSAETGRMSAHTSQPVKAGTHHAAPHGAQAKQGKAAGPAQARKTGKSTHASQ